ncbi:hypothetical protein [Streptomyces sp. ITFR-6]|uniref:hypothetical protein n=1 Tax=Streptomyces sp. ITFR-6 TaxID=3075197 RepID=UPI00288B152A|nr:hypothetical protein [Streptomyces sp. ITFR-6]WNI32828.1 hypothetical protein RLT59_31560 [Streptomyces sp. ITFR-6]
MTGFTVPRARATLAVLAGVLCAAQFAEGTARADAPGGGMETRHGPSLITIDNSNADSWLEIDRTLNVLGPLSKGTAGSDHDGAAVPSNSTSRALRTPGSRPPRWSGASRTNRTALRQGSIRRSPAPFPAPFPFPFP